MSAFLYIWNPNRWAWDDISYAINSVSEKNPYEIEWSSGNRKKGISIDDVFFMMRLGQEPKGIIGCGYIISKPKNVEHWDQSEAEKGHKAFKTNLRFMAISEKPIISISELVKRYPSVTWTPQQSGIALDSQIAFDLFEEIKNSKLYGFQNNTESRDNTYTEGEISTVTSKNYDRSPRARQACIDHFGYNCSVCDFSFIEAYGHKFIEVHHLKMISESSGEYIINPIIDLRPVCANCHRVIHSQNPPLSIEEMILKYRNQKLLKY